MCVIDSRKIIAESLDPFLLVILGVELVEQGGNDRLLVVDAVLHQLFFS